LATTLIPVVAELDRLPLQLALPAAVLGEYRLRRSPERPVVEEDDLRIE
jgi:hypothetical protein